MTFQPFVAVGGLGGWRFLQSTLATQKAAFEKGGLVTREIEYFREKIGEVKTAEDLVSDYRLLKVALGAFGLSEDINSKYLIRRVLEEGTIETDALANKLSDKRYRDLSKAFGFGDFAVPNTVMSDFADRIERQYLDRSFEVALGETDESMRLALNAKRELATLAEGSGSNRTKWFTLLGTPPLRTVIEGALGLPKVFAALPIDKQYDTLISRAESTFGTSEISRLGEPDLVARIVDLYTARVGAATSSQASSPALQILRGF